MFVDIEHRVSLYSASGQATDPPYHKSHNARRPCTTSQAPLVSVGPQPPPSMGDRWYFAGLNASAVIRTGNLQGGRADIRSLTPIPDLTPKLDEEVDVLFACWSQVVFRSGDRLLLRGFRAGSVDDITASNITSLIGDHNGISGALDRHGNVYLADTQALRDVDAPLTLPLVSHEDSPRLAKVSVAGNFRVAVAIRPAPGATTTHVEEFRDLASFRRWYSDPANPQNYPAKHHQIGGRIKQIISNSKVFVCLTEAGQVLTWGDPRHGGLGRTTTQPGDVPAAQPGLLTTLDGIRIIKVSGGGQMFAALSEDKAVYIWSGAEQRSQSGLTVCREAQGDQMALVDILDEEGEPYDFEDLAVGHGHILLRTTDGKVYAAGDNTNGQLGIGSEDTYRSDFVKIVSGGCSSIRAASKSSVIRATMPPN
ncbi:hypothetical protein KVT40_004941 [Elsinoe batatas]|uniref:Regulator of chromosome condensation 1/beta-lactamase-inhibitor protein II n=1 Tax=Elsinoe batatas TaxID=2601811 RepID=A0A8K0L835_9PEZI|nr:hypothetical protein KVT40_004941 [Elsinoe batatas]